MDIINKMAVDAISNSIVDTLKNMIEKLPYDKTTTGVVKRKYTESSVDYYDVSIKGRTYKCTSLNSVSYSINDRVYLRIPCNDWSNIYIEGKVGY